MSQPKSRGANLTPPPPPSITKQRPAVGPLRTGGVQAQSPKPHHHRLVRPSLTESTAPPPPPPPLPGPLSSASLCSADSALARPRHHVTPPSPARAPMPTPPRRLVRSDLSPQQLLALFNAGKDGRVGVDKFREALPKFGIELTPDELQEVLPRTRSGTVNVISWIHDVAAAASGRAPPPPPEGLGTTGGCVQGRTRPLLKGGPTGVGGRGVGGWVRGLWVGGLVWFWAIWPNPHTPPPGGGGSGWVGGLATG